MAEVIAWLHVDTSKSKTRDLLFEESKNSYPNHNSRWSGPRFRDWRFEGKLIDDSVVPQVQRRWLCWGGEKPLFRGSTFLQFSVHDWHERIPNKLLVASHSANQPVSPPCWWQIPQPKSLHSFMPEPGETSEFLPLTHIPKVDGWPQKWNVPLREWRSAKNAQTSEYNKPIH